MRSAPYIDIINVCLQSVEETRPVDHISESKSDDGSHHGRLCGSTACSCGPECIGMQSSKRDLVHARRSSTQIATKKSSWNVAINMKYPAVGLFVQSVTLDSDEKVGSCMSIRGAGRPFYVQSNSNRTRKS